MPAKHAALALLYVGLFLLPPGSSAQKAAIDLSHKGLPEQTLRSADAVFQGHFSVDPKTSLITGELNITWDNGNRYSGSMRDSKRHGRGRFTWSNGQHYDGDWLDDQATGQASILYANGDRYEGAVISGQPDGQGTKTFASGTQYYAGQWKAGQRHGRGIFRWTDGQSFDGDWIADQPEGQGTLIFANGDRYTGAVHAGLPHGRGKKTFALSGDRYEGEFEHGLAHGEGLYVWPTGDRYRGQWLAGRKHGNGRYTWHNGDYWEGRFSDDQHAEGRLYFTPNLNLDQAGIDKLMQQTRAASDSFSIRPDIPETEKPVNLERLAAIPLVSIELASCARPGSASDCRLRLLDAVVRGQHFEHDWQAMFTEKNLSYEVDRRSQSAEGRVFSWFRFLDSRNGSSRKTGILYDCRKQALEIQLLYACPAGSASCVLDRNFDKYVGKSLPAATIRNWFKGGCERRP